MQRDNTFTYRDTSADNTYLGNSIKIILPPKPGFEGPDYNAGGMNNQGESRMDIGALTLSCLAQDPNLPSSKLPFAWKLYEMLETVHKNKVDTDIVSWVDDGKAFKVHDLKRFVDEIVPTYFKQSKYKSFQRQLYFYGFIRETAAGKEGHTPGSYRHPRFVRGQKTWCLSMAPKKSKKRGGSKSPVLGASATKKAAPSGDSVAAGHPAVVREVSSEIGDNSLPGPMNNNMTQFPLHQHMNSAFGAANIVSQDADAQHQGGDFDNPQMKFRQQQNQLQRLQIQGFLQSLQQSERQNLPTMHQEAPPAAAPPAPAPPAPSLRHSVSEGIECQMFGGTFHVVGRKTSN